MNISDLIKDETVFMDLNVSSRDECLDIMINGMEKSRCVTDKAAYKAAVLEREKMGSTGVGFGVAIPHGKSNAVVASGLAFARVIKPIDWNSLDGNPVQLVFLIGVPEKEAGNEHLKILAAISRKLIHDEFRNQLMDAKSSSEILSILQSI